MSKKKARRRRAAHRANETRLGGDALSSELVKRSRKLVMLQAKKRNLLRSVANVDKAIAAARVELKATADAAVNENIAPTGTLPGDA